MRDLCTITSRFLANQMTFFRLAARAGFSQKVIHLETGYSLSAIGQWARGESAMGGPAILALADVKDMPSDILSTILDGTNRHVVDGEDPEDAIDDLGDAADEVARKVRQARHPHSPGGTDIVPSEHEDIQRSVLVMRHREKAA